MTKIFIIGLPRTGTTSVCVDMLALGYRVAHTAYINKAFEQADVIADTPVFCDYPILDNYYTNSKFIYLERNLSDWIPSIRQLLTRMLNNLMRKDGGFNPIIKRCYGTVFGQLTLEKINSDEFLSLCYQQHHQQVRNYFNTRKDDFLSLDISQPNSYAQLLSFLSKASQKTQFQHLNRGGKVTAWKDIVDTHKVNSTNNGRAERLFYQI